MCDCRGLDSMDEPTDRVVARPRRRARTRRFAVVAIGAALVGVSLSAASSAAATPMGCPDGYNLCIPPQGANEGVKAAPGGLVLVGYSFRIGSDTTEVKVSSAYEELSVTCTNGTAAAQPSIQVPVPDAVYTKPFADGWLPNGDEGDVASYEVQYPMPDLCGGSVMAIGQPGEMMFAAKVSVIGNDSLSFRSHYNGYANGNLTNAGSWSATKSVTGSAVTCL